MSTNRDKAGAVTSRRAELAREVEAARLLYPWLSLTYTGGDSARVSGTTPYVFGRMDLSGFTFERLHLGLDLAARVLPSMAGQEANGTGTTREDVLSAIVANAAFAASVIAEALKYGRDRPLGVGSIAGQLTEAHSRITANLARLNGEG